MKIQSIDSLYKRIDSFFLTDNADAVIYAGTDEVIFLHHSTGSDASFNLFAFSIRNSKTYSWVFVLVTHGNAPFVLDGSRVMILNHSQATVDYSQFNIKDVDYVKPSDRLLCEIVLLICY